MREIVEIKFDKQSRMYSVDLFDEDEGWKRVVINDIDTLMYDYSQELDKLNVDSLDDHEKKLLKERFQYYNNSIQKPIETHQVCNEINGVKELDNIDYYDYQIFYVTDIHLDEKISRKYGETYSKDKEEEIISSCVSNIAKDYCEIEFNNKLLLIGGDVSHHYHLVDSFYRQLTNVIPGKQIMAILGNHELWGCDNSNSSDMSLDELFQSYGRLFDSFHISFANNMLFSYKGGNRYYVRGEELLKATDKEIQDYVSDSLVTILGGVGFAGLNCKYNCECGLYKDVIRDRLVEKNLSQQFNAIYQKVLQAVPHKKIIILTHMPLSDWSDQDPNPNWIYINGHTHRNELLLSDTKMIYSDNQIGYGGTVHLKKFNFNIRTDTFHSYKDGIFEISKELYRDYYRYMGLSMTCNREGHYYMVKRDPYHCFFLKTERNLYILDGGSVNIAHHDLDYYYDNLTLYGEKINDFMRKYQDSLKKISSFIRRIGGDGRIHGCIIDIDFFNHIYLNPFDWKITAYSATDMVNKNVYNSMESLLESERIDLYQNYIQLLKSNDTILPSEIRNETTDVGIYHGTDIYAISRLFLKMQHCLQYSIIRKWNDALLVSKNIEKWNKELMGMFTNNYLKAIK